MMVDVAAAVLLLDATIASHRLSVGTLQGCEAESAIAADMATGTAAAVAAVLVQNSVDEILPHSQLAQFLVGIGAGRPRPVSGVAEAVADGFDSKQFVLGSCGLHGTLALKSAHAIWQLHWHLTRSSASLDLRDAWNGLGRRIGKWLCGDLAGAASSAARQSDPMPCCGTAEAAAAIAGATASVAGN
mmetsp:Transcript_2723/g.6589  ORF Transcript_2723/g.6589 Transcript_2723/m.6589 type:complete len:187 (+) Transcript_2723:758-1318(+)